MPIVQPGLLKRPGTGSCRLWNAEPMSDWAVYHIQNRKRKPSGIAGRLFAWSYEGQAASAESSGS